MKRRTLLAMSAFAAGCGRTRACISETAPPRRQRLVMAIGAGPGTLDPGVSWEFGSRTRSGRCSKV